MGQHRTPGVSANGLVLTHVWAVILFCGQPKLNTRIVGGQVAPVGSWPWQVSLQTSGSHFCGGSLINSQWVVSSFSVEHIEFSCNEMWYINEMITCKYLTGQEVKLYICFLVYNNCNNCALFIIKHPNYNSGTNDNDICLLRLSSPVTFNNYISPVCLAASDSGSLVQVPVVGNRQCNCNYGVGRITDNMICAGLSAGGKDSCQGDSGGPMVSKQIGRWIQAGIVSFREGCARPNLPGVYTRVSKYQTWITSQITSN
uniref:Serine protease 27-like n=1 Tax=Haplochromis burtoni TaxID=8153 RepID=A0A3Q3BZ45_HAPBU